jgi:ribonuclease VapC
VNRAVLDASALMAVINKEAGGEKLTLEIMSLAVTSTVNLAEVHGKLIQRGFAPDDAWTATRMTVQEAVDFTAEQAKIAGDLVAQTRSLGLSLGDRACVALGISLRAPIYTADKAWKNLNVGVRIHVIR